MKPLFASGESLDTARLRLTNATRADIEAMPWLEAALAPEFGLPDLLPHVEAGEAVLICRREAGEDAAGRMGLAVAISGAPGAGMATVPFIAIEPAGRFRGLGGEAGLALEGRIIESWAPSAVFAPVPEGRGLAVYFWLRLGYAALTLADAPWPVTSLNGRELPGIWMRRMAD